MDSLGRLISPLALADGTPVYDRAGERIGVVDHVLSDERSGIFEGLIVHTRPLPGRHVYVHHDQIAGAHERGVVLSVEREDLHEIEERDRHRHRSAESPEPRIEAILRRAWDWVNGFS